MSRAQPALRLRVKALHEMGCALSVKKVAVALRMLRWAGLEQ